MLAVSLKIVRPPARYELRIMLWRFYSPEANMRLRVKDICQVSTFYSRQMSIVLRHYKPTLYSKRFTLYFKIALTFDILTEQLRKIIWSFINHKVLKLKCQKFMVIFKVMLESYIRFLDIKFCDLVTLHFDILISQLSRKLYVASLHAIFSSNLDIDILQRVHT